MSSAGQRELDDVHTVGYAASSAQLVGKKKKVPKLKIEKQPDYQDEFMAKYSEFSQSWRD